MVEYKLPHPSVRQTYSAHSTLDEAKWAGNELVRLLNGTPFGYRLAIYERMGAFVLLSYATTTEQQERAR